MGRIEVNGGLLVYSPGSRCVEVLEAVREAGIGDGLEIGCVAGSAGVIGVELRYKCLYGGTFRRVMSRPYPGGFLSINLEALKKKYLEMLRIKQMYSEVSRSRGMPLSRVLGIEV
jgi:hypothetical protein